MGLAFLVELAFLKGARPAGGPQGHVGDPVLTGRPRPPARPRISLMGDIDRPADSPAPTPAAAGPDADEALRLARRRFFREMASDAVRTAATLVGAAGALRETTQEMAGTVLTDPTPPATGRPATAQAVAVPAAPPGSGARSAWRSGSSSSSTSDACPTSWSRSTCAVRRRRRPGDPGHGRPRRTGPRAGGGCRPGAGRGPRHPVEAVRAPGDPARLRQRARQRATDRRLDPLRRPTGCWRGTRSSGAGRRRAGDRGRPARGGRGDHRRGDPRPCRDGPPGRGPPAGPRGTAPAPADPLQHGPARVRPGRDGPGRRPGARGRRSRAPRVRGRDAAVAAGRPPHGLGAGPGRDPLHAPRRRGGRLAARRPATSTPSWWARTGSPPTGTRPTRSAPIRWPSWPPATACRSTSWRRRRPSTARPPTARGSRWRCAPRARSPRSPDGAPRRPERRR